MTARRRLALTALAACSGIAAAAHPNARPALLWNTTASAPEGLYALRPIARPGVGDWVAAAPPPLLAAWLDRRGYLPAGALLIKQVAAVPPSVVCHDGAGISIDGRRRAHTEPADRYGRSLPSWRGCRRLVDGEVFVLNRARGSLDSRYFGPLPSAAIVGRAVLLLVWGGGHDA
ncbi:S26 family signal peptidase [Phenylobacterium soli]|uniref:Peptidase n=1 Tax=Phenylobacterium soli TaxID=2170551 RepID=A0A328ANA4_9CAUL|nr:S26 family signal peptidase [Phenylobacterium soli]RAK54924.1 peptidase [Phenylobacterium soli]